MVVKCLLAAMLFPMAAKGSTEWNDSVIGHVAERNMSVYILLKTPCPTPILGLVQKKARKGFLYAEEQGPSGLVKGCWIPVNNQIVFIWEDGAVGILPQRVFNLLRQT